MSELKNPARLGFFFARIDHGLAKAKTALYGEDLSGDNPNPDAALVALNGIEGDFANLHDLVQEEQDAKDGD